MEPDCLKHCVVTYINKLFRATYPLENTGTYKLNINETDCRVTGCTLTSALYKKMASCFLLHWALQINITDSQQQLAQILFNLLRVLKQNI